MSTPLGQGQGPDSIGQSQPDATIADATIVFGSIAAQNVRRRVSVLETCEAIGLARSTYYYQSRRSLSSIAFEHRIVLRLHELSELHPNAGYRAMTRLLQREGFRVNHKRIARLMQLHRLSTDASYASGAGNLLKSARLTGPGQVWIADIAYVHANCGLVYAAAIIDAWSRVAIGYALSNQISNRLASIALHAAVRAQRPAQGCLHHSACGTQYRIRGYGRLLKRHGLTPSGPDLRAVGMDALARGHALRRIVKVDGYDTWSDVSRRAQEFVQTIYAPGRIEQMFEQWGVSHALRNTVAQVCPGRSTAIAYSSAASLSAYQRSKVCTQSSTG